MTLTKFVKWLEDNDFDRWAIGTTGEVAMTDDDDGLYVAKVWVGYRGAIGGGETLEEALDSAVAEVERILELGDY